MQESAEIEAIGEEAGRMVRAVIDEAETLGEAAEKLLAAIRSEPFKSTLISLGAGAILGFLMNRDRD